MGFWSRLGGGVRNVVQSIPGGSQAFPTEANGTINWLGNPLRGDNVLGSAFRGASGLDTAEAVGSGIRNAFGGGSAAAPRPGSVVGRGFIGPRPNAIRDNQAAGVPRIGSVIGDEYGRQAREEVDPRIPAGGSNAGSNAGGGSRFGRSTARITGGDVSLSEHIARQSLLADRER